MRSQGLFKWAVPVLAMGLSLVATIAPANAAIINWSADAFDADSDISTRGILVKAVNEGASQAVTVNGVTFAASPGGNSFFAISGTDVIDPTKYAGGAIGSLTSTDAQTLLDSFEYAAGDGNSLARLSGLIVGQEYELQVLRVDDRSVARSQTTAIGHATPSGNTTEVYTLTGIDHSSNHPYVFTGIFTANEALQDVHIANSNSQNGEVHAWQLRLLSASVPEPSSLSLIGFGLACMIAFGLRRNR